MQCRHSQIGTKIKNRVVPNDKIYTPFLVIEKHLEILKNTIKAEDIIYEPFAGDKRYIQYFNKHFPDNQTVYTEIDEGLDFFTFNDKVDVVITNPPYSCVTPVINKLIELKPRIISLLIGVINLTISRIKKMNDNGYYIKSYCIVNIKNWFSNSVIITFSNEINKNLIDVVYSTYK